MPIETLPDEGKALFEKVFEKALIESSEDDARKVAWSAIEKVGWVEDGDGSWHKKSLSEFSLAITRAAYDKATNRMNWRAVASDTDTDFFDDNMTSELFEDFVNRIELEESPPEKHRSNFWRGGVPYLSVSHYPDLDGKAVPGVVEKVYIDGNRLKATGYFEDTPLGRACFRSVCNDLYGKEEHPEGKVRISIAFLDFSHRHKSNGFVFDRENGEEKFCMECIREFITEETEGLEFLKGLLIHLALTRVPANARTLFETLEVDKMAIETKKEDALSIVEGDEEAKALIEEIAEEAKSVNRSELVIKSEADKPKKEKEEEDEETEEKAPEKEKSLSVDFTPVLEAIAELKSVPATEVEETPEHPLDEIMTAFRSQYDEAVAKGLGFDETLQGLQESFKGFSEGLVEQVRSVTNSEPEGEEVTATPGANVDEVTDAVMRKIGPDIAELKSLIQGMVPAAPDNSGDVRQLVQRRSFLPTELNQQKSLQNKETKVKSGYSVDEIVDVTTRQ